MAANELKGEVELEVGGKVYTLLLGFNAICLVEAESKQKIIQILARFGGEPEANITRLCLWAALQLHHKGTTLEQAGELIQEAGLFPVLNLLRASYNAAFPHEEDAKAAGHPSPGAAAATAPPTAKTRVRRRAGTSGAASRSGSSST